MVDQHLCRQVRELALCQSLTSELLHSLSRYFTTREAFFGRSDSYVLLVSAIVMSQRLKTLGLLELLDKLHVLLECIYLTLVPLLDT